MLEGACTTSADRAVTKAFRRIPKAERFVHVKSAESGFETLNVWVNGAEVRTVKLKGGAQQGYQYCLGDDVGPGQNMVTLIGTGSPGAKAEVMIGNLRLARARR